MNQSPRENSKMVRPGSELKKLRTLAKPVSRMSMERRDELRSSASRTRCASQGKAWMSRLLKACTNLVEDRPARDVPSRPHRQARCT